jgi:hypothetical protein
MISSKDGAVSAFSGWRQEIVACAKECEYALRRAQFHEEGGRPHVAAISRGRAMTAAHNAEIIARAIARMETP